MLVYKYLSEGSLQDRLNGLEYLHGGCSACIVHQDVKSSSILLTGTKDAAKVADFGLSRLFPEEDGSITFVKGSQGYINPKYVTSHFLTSKSNVYNFDVVLLELLMGRVPLPSSSQPQSDFAWTLSDWTLQSRGDPDNILDRGVLAGQPDKDAVWKVTDLAMAHVEPKSVHRPTMAEVVHKLRDALAMEEARSKAAFQFQPPYQRSWTWLSSFGMDSMDFSSNATSLPFAQ